MAARPIDNSDAQRLWDNVTSELLKAASAQRLDRRFATPERWPGYYLVRQRAIASAVRGRLSSPRATHRTSVSSVAGAEKLLSVRNGLLAGKPDYFDDQCVTEYKSALPDPAWPEAASLLEGYWRQLRLYAVLVSETAGWPALLRIVSAAGQFLEQNVDRQLCEAEADAAIAGLDSMNRELERGCGTDELASPGEISCAQCQYQAICPAFWSWCASASWPHLRRPAARGTLESTDPGVDGDLYAVTLRLEGRHGDRGPLSLALRRSVHGDLTGCDKGKQIRVVYAHARRDGRLRADINTCVFSEDELPDLESAGAT